nr:Transporter [Kibdelosporangium sp. MJ126-NF4]CTQ96802.1 Transporter [Kibdelosporangium sp. MJ126-NF4]
MLLPNWSADDAPANSAVRNAAFQVVSPPTGEESSPPSFAKPMDMTSEALDTPEEEEPEAATPAEAAELKAKKKLTDIVVEKVNTERKRAGCKPLGKAAALTKSAQRHSDDMSKRDYFSHTTPEGVTFDQRIKKAGYPRPGAENIAKGATTATKVMSLWMNSAGHKRNILNCDLKKIGVGLAKDGWYWTQNFGY